MSLLYLTNSKKKRGGRSKKGSRDVSVVYILFALLLLLGFGSFFAWESFSPTGFVVLDINQEVSSEAYLEIDGVSRGISANLTTNEDGVRVYALSTLSLDLTPGEHTVKLYDAGTLVFEETVVVGDVVALPDIIVDVPVENDTIVNVTIPTPTHISEGEKYVPEPLGNSSQQKLATPNSSVVTPEGASVHVLSEMPVGAVHVGVPVSWQRDVILAAGDVDLSVPVAASDVVLRKEQEVVALEEGVTAASVGNVTLRAQIPLTGVHTLSYTLPGPEQTVADVSSYEKHVHISSEQHIAVPIVTNISVGDVPAGSVAVYHLVNNSRVLVEEATLHDTNDNDLVDVVAWTVPHLSDQSYVVELTLLNPVSSPVVGGNWTVLFNTTGVANLTVTAINGTTFGEELFDDYGTFDDLRFLDLTCNNISQVDDVLAVFVNGTELAYSSLQPTDSYVVESFKVADYSCNFTSSFVDEVVTTGKHYLQFTYGGVGFNDSVQFASNDASCNSCSTCDSAVNAGDGYVSTTRNLTNFNTTRACIEFKTNDVVFDCLGHNVTEVPGHGSVGFHFPPVGSGLWNITIQNCYFNDIGNSSVFVEDTINVTIINSTFANATTHIETGEVYGLNVTNNVFTTSGDILLRGINESVFAFNEFTGIDYSTAYMRFTGTTTNLTVHNNTFRDMAANVIAVSHADASIYNLTIQFNQFIDVVTRSIIFEAQLGPSFVESAIIYNTFRDGYEPDATNAGLINRADIFMSGFDDSGDAGNFIAHNTFLNFSHTAVSLNYTDYVLIRNNTFRGNVDSDTMYAAVRVRSSDHNQIANNTVTSGQHAVVIETRPVDNDLVSSSSNNSIQHNNITNTHAYGVFLNRTGATNEVIANNLTNSSSVTIFSYGPGPVLIHNNTIQPLNNGGVEITEASDFEIVGNGFVSQAGTTMVDIKNSSSNFTISNNSFSSVETGITLTDVLNATIVDNDARTISAVMVDAVNVTNITFMGNFISHSMNLSLRFRNVTSGVVAHNNFDNASATTLANFALRFVDTYRVDLILNNITANQFPIGGEFYNDSILDQNRFNSTDNHCTDFSNSHTLNLTNNTFLECRSLDGFLAFEIDSVNTNFLFVRNNFTEMNGTTESTTVSFNSSSEGNFWGQFDTVAEGCIDNNGDSICDSVFNIYDSLDELAAVFTNDSFPFGGDADLAPAVVNLTPVNTSIFEAGNVIEISVNVTDGGGVENVSANITLPNASVTELPLFNHSFLDKYNASYTIPFLLGNYNVTFIANDTSGNLNNSEETNFTATDTTAPSLVNATPVNTSLFEIGSVIEISINVTDGIGVANVSANITLPNASVTELPLFNHSFLDKYNASYSVPLLIGNYNITFIANDTEGNLNNTEETNFTATDTTAPSLVNATPVNTSLFEIDSIIEVSINVTDLVGVENVSANITLPNASVTELPLFNHSFLDKYNASYRIPLHIGNYNITFIANDTEGNLNSSETTNFTATDTTAPTVVNQTPVNTSVFAVGSVIEISINVTDSVGVESVTANVTLPNASVTGLTLANASFADTFNVSYTVVGALGNFDITYFVSDTQGNLNDTEVTNFSSFDETPPTVSDIIPVNNSAFTVDDAITISANVTDATIIDVVFANVTQPDTNTVIVTLTNATSTTNTYSGTYTILYSGLHNITIVANDTSENLNNSETTNFTATAATEAEEETVAVGGSGAGGSVDAPIVPADVLTGTLPVAELPAPELGLDGRVQLRYVDEQGLRKSVLDFMLDAATFGGATWREVALRHLSWRDYVMAFLLLCSFGLVVSMLHDGRMGMPEFFSRLIGRFRHAESLAVKRVYYHRHFTASLHQLDAALAQGQIVYARELYSSLSGAYEQLEPYLSTSDKKAIYKHLLEAYEALSGK